MSNTPLGEETLCEELDLTLQTCCEPETPEAEVETSMDSAEVDSKGKNQPKVQDSEVEKLAHEISQLNDPESKLLRTLQFMEEALLRSNSPNFKRFWQARTLCLPLFKEHISPTGRAQLWEKYTQLCQEARRLKDMLEEQGAFAAEQIEIAIQALESALQQAPQAQEKITTLSCAPCQALEAHLAYYSQQQHQLDILNTYAARINALRKELIKTDMRIRKKNLLFQRLSEAGGCVFPKRKVLIKEMGQRFIQDVDSFIEKYFSHENQHAPLFFLREEIKAMQSMAKLLTLNAHAFTSTRLLLSECWDKVKQLDKERKKQRAQQQSIIKQNTEEFVQKIQAATQEIQSEGLSPTDALLKLDALGSTLRDMQLGRDETKFLRDALNNARKPFFDQINAAELARQEQERERIEARHQKIIHFKQEVQTLLSSALSMDAESLTTERDALLAKIATAQMTKSEKQELERLLKPLRDMIADKKEQDLLKLPDNERQQLTQLYDLIEQKKERYQEIKDQLEAIRKAKGGSGLTFQQGMEYEAQLQAEKERLAKVTQGIHEIEQKIAELERIR